MISSILAIAKRMSGVKLLAWVAFRWKLLLRLVRSHPMYAFLISKGNMPNL